jgi:hypothetical protein
MHYNFLFNGCSFTVGGELEGPYNDIEYQRTHRFSNLVANHFGMNYENISSNGASNDWIVEKTIEWIEEGNTCDIAVIQFSVRYRTVWYDQDSKIEYRISPKKIINSNPRLKYVQSLYYKTFYSDILGIQNFYKNLFFLTNYFESKNIKYVFLSLKHIEKESNSYGWARYCKKQKIVDIVNLLGKKDNNREFTIVNDNYCPDLQQQYPNNPRYQFLLGGHPSEIGHQKIAEYIINRIQELET